MVKEQELNKEIYLQLSNSTVSPKTIKSHNRQNDEGSSESNLSESERNKALAKQYSNGEVLEENNSHNLIPEEINYHNPYQTNFHGRRPKNSDV